MDKVKAMVHSLGSLDEVKIVSENGLNDIVAEYKGKKYTAIFNPFTGLYYVDDLFGEVE